MTKEKTLSRIIRVHKEKPAIIIAYAGMIIGLMFAYVLIKSIIDMLF